MVSYYTCTDFNSTFLFVSDPCDFNSCRRGGTCTWDLTGEFSCQCVGGFHGKECELCKCMCIIMLILHVTLVHQDHLIEIYIVHPCDPTVVICYLI